MIFLTTFISVATMVALALPGFILRKKNMLPEKAVATLVAVLIYASQPFLTISSFLSKEYKPSLLVNMAITFGFSLALHVVLFLVATLVFSFFKTKKREDESDEEYEARRLCNDKQNRIGTITSFMGNIGFMGIPVMKMLFPDNPEMLIYTAVFMVGFNISSWTLGVYAITGDKKNISLKSAFLNPAVATLGIALLLFFFKQYIPAKVLNPLSDGISYLAEMTLPLSMIIIGIRLADVKASSLFTSSKTYVTCGMKLLVAPLATLGIALLVKLIFPTLDTSVIKTIFICMAMPSAAMNLSFAEKFDGDRDSAVRATLLTTVLSILTISLLMLLCDFIPALG